MVSLNCNEYVYWTIASCFVRPHWTFYKMKKKYYTRQHALDSHLLDCYLKDVFSSFFLFFVMIGPITYKAYFTNDFDGAMGDKPH